MTKYFLFILLGVSQFLRAQEPPLIKPGRVIFYNVENLFDTLHDPNTRDDAFLPDSKKQWNSEKYQAKIRHITQVLSSMLDTIQPIVIGLDGVENEKVLQDLVAQPELQKYNLGIVHHDSPDTSGLDVALLYNPLMVGEVFDAFLPIEPSDDNTRNISYFKAYLDEGSPLWVFVNHWSNRINGKEENESKRLFEEKILRTKIDNVLLGEPKAKIIIMGDFNDNPSDKSLTELTKPDKSESRLINLMHPLYQKKEYSANDKGEKGLFDQLIVSQNLMDTATYYHIENKEAHIYSPNWLMYKSKKEGYVPMGTFEGDKWINGYSNHLPVYFDLIFK